ncbi:MAG: hypothetical protein JW983_06860 [Elusimicrobia bacterium]|nr:hypothetical protein [Elusimicrobiota bacterium]
MSDKLKLLVLLVFSVLCFQIVFFERITGATKHLSKDEWTQALTELGIEPEEGLVIKLFSASNTVEKIKKQTKGELGLKGWIEIFEKMGIKPKNVDEEKWAAIFRHMGVEAKIVPHDRPYIAEQPAPAKPEPDKSEKLESPQKELKIEKPVDISLDLRGMDILAVLKIISKKSGLNIVAGNNVRGDVTIYLNNVDVIDAFKIILEMNSLAYRMDGDIVQVITVQDYERIYGKKFYDKTIIEVVPLKYAKAQVIGKMIELFKSKVGQIIPDNGSNCLILIDTPDSIKLLKKLISNFDVRMETKVFALNYAKIDDILPKLKNIASPELGEIQADKRTSQVIVTDFPEKMEEISKFIATVDKKHKEVLIEAKIVQILLGNEFKMGVNWEYVFKNINTKSISGKVEGNLTALPVGSSGINLSVGTLEIDDFTVLLDFLQTIGKTNLLSSPRIAALEGEEAKILVGTKEAYVTTSVTTAGSGVSTTAESVTFVDVGVKLYVTPTIGDDGYVTMKIRPEVSSVDRTLTTAQGNTVPIVRTSETETTVMVKDGVTVVIGGLIEQRKEKRVSGIPLLVHIPILGLPFRRTTYENVKTELSVFLTPRIMTGDVPYVAPVSGKKKK